MSITSKLLPAARVPGDAPNEGGMAVPSAVEGAIKDVVSQFWNSDKATVDDTMTKLVAAAKAQ